MELWKLFFNKICCHDITIPKTELALSQFLVALWLLVELEHVRDVSILQVWQFYMIKPHKLTFYCETELALRFQG